MPWMSEADWYDLEPADDDWDDYHEDQDLDYWDEDPIVETEE